MEILEFLQEKANNFSLETSKKTIAQKLYWEAKAAGHDICILNTIYLKSNGKEIQFIKSKKQNKWIVKEF